MSEYSSMMYEIEVDIDGYISNDVSEFAVFRCPFVKTASFSMLIINVPTIVFIGIETECKAHKFLPVKIVIKQNDMSIGKPDNYGETKIVCTKNYIILNIESFEKSDLSQPYISIILYLVNPILYYLCTTNSYNIILEDKTGLDILKDFEKYLKTTYGDKTFDFIKIGETQNVNKFQYEQILIQSHNDLLIPTIIIQNYKPFDSFSFYFFDDFVITEDNKFDIIGYLINLNDVEPFKKIDCTKDNYVDILTSNKYISTTIINDIFNILNQTNASKIICGSDLQFKYKKPEAKNTVDNIQVQTDTTTLEPERTINVISSTIMKKETQPTEQTILYTSDDIDIAMNRLNIIKTQLTDKLELVIHYYLKTSHFEFFQFGNIYNIDAFEDQGYFYTPISLVNVFKRGLGQIPLLNHHLHYQLLKFKQET